MLLHLMGRAKNTSQYEPTALHPFQKLLGYYEKWIDKAIADGSTLEDLADWLESCVHSSAFSGIGAPEVSFLSLRLAVQAKMPERKAREGYHVC